MEKENKDVCKHCFSDHGLNYLPTLTERFSPELNCYVKIDVRVYRCSLCSQLTTVC